MLPREARVSLVRRIYCFQTMKGPMIYVVFGSVNQLSTLAYNFFWVNPGSFRRQCPRDSRASTCAAAFVLIPRSTLIRWSRMNTIPNWSYNIWNTYLYAICHGVRGQDNAHAAPINAVPSPYCRSQFTNHQTQSGVMANMGVHNCSIVVLVLLPLLLASSSSAATDFDFFYNVQQVCNIIISSPYRCLARQVV
jgi:hypothetical protein